MPLLRRRLTGSLRAAGPSWRARLAALSAAALACALAPTLPLAGEVPATLADDPALPRIVAGGRAFHGLVVGDARDPVVLAVHDGPGGDFSPLAALRALTTAPTETERTAAATLDVPVGERTYRVAFYDQRGSGLSPRDDGPLGFEDALADLGALVEAVAGDGEVRLVGQGWGAMLAAAYIGRNPNRVAGAVLAEPLFLDADDGERYLAGRTRPIDAAERLRAAWRAYRALAMFGPDGQARADWRAAGRLEREVAARVPPRGCPPASAPVYTRVGAAVPRAVWRSLSGADGRLDPGLADMAAGAGRYGRSLRLLAGACSPLREATAQRVPRFLDAHVVVVPDAGHDLFVDAPAAAVAAVRGHLDALRDEDEAAEESTTPASP